jgi:hypothetical protein
MLGGSIFFLIRKIKKNLQVGLGIWTLDQAIQKNQSTNFDNLQKEF